MFWIGVIVLVVLIYMISKRNSFNEMRRKVTQQGAEIGIQMEKRAECLNDAMNILKKSHEREVSGIERLTDKDKFDNLAFLGQKYPELSSVPGYHEVMREALSLNKDISATRELLNANIRAYNDAITAFPGLLVAKLFGYKEEKFIDEENIEQNKVLKKQEVDFSKF